MPHKDPEAKRRYHREYMRRRRAGEVKPSPVKPKAHLPEPSGEPTSPFVLDRTRPFHEERRFPHPAYLVQSWWFNPETGAAVKAAP
jgi:hypothetical protein